MYTTILFVNKNKNYSRYLSYLKIREKNLSKMDFCGFTARERFKFFYSIKLSN